MYVKRRRAEGGSVRGRRSTRGREIYSRRIWLQYFVRIPLDKAYINVQLFGKVNHQLTPNIVEFILDSTNKYTFKY